ncbi:HNH endonuclease signature motif containing protein [Kocuria salina]|uniref:HNH endonuclease signature motif containing protein n=1 Tax=Kocuria salina TaxID=1929416 RepID=UPI001593E503
MSKPTREERFWAKVDKAGPVPQRCPDLGRCWLWTGAKGGNGYGYFRADGRPVGAHRFSYSLQHGPIPDRVEVDHVCHVLMCVNPSHLRPASRKQNGEYRSGAQSNNESSGVRNVYREVGGWRVQIKHNGRRTSFGTYPTIAEAEAVAIRERDRLFTFSERTFA